MLHAAVLSELLDDEVAVARQRLGDRVMSIENDGFDIYCRFEVVAAATEHRLRLRGRAYDAVPFRVAAVDQDGRTLPAAGWPPGLCHGDHPVLHVPFACVQGTWEYHTHPQHVADVWDRYRHSCRLGDLLSHLLRRCGA
jgi:hypothetical protein